MALSDQTEGSSGEPFLRVTEENRVLDRAALVDLIDGDMEFLQSMIEIFLSSAAGYIEEIHEALRAGDAEALHEVAHRLKGAAGNIRAYDTYDAAKQLEAFGREQDLTAAAEHVHRLEAAFARLRSVLTSMQE